MDDLHAYLAAVGVADAAAAVAVVDEAVGRGVPRQRLIRDLLAPAQRRAGDLWFEGAWSIADEHAATGVCEQVLTVLSPPRPVPRDARVRVVIACAEGEWHTLPARLAAELARSSDVSVTVLGGSIPADHLARHLVTVQADVLALSCTMSTNLLGAARNIAAAHAVSVPVVVGGRAWGAGQHRAQRLGADRRLDDSAGLVDALDSLPDSWPADVALPAEALLLDAPPQELLLLALERQCGADRWMRDMTPFQRARSLEDLEWIARHAAAAVACDDPTIVRELLAWLLGLLRPRGVPAAAVIESCHYLADAVEPDAPQAAVLLRAEADAAYVPEGS